MKPWHIAVIGLLFSLPALGSEEIIVQPYQVIISADAGKPFGDVTTEITVEKKAEHRKIIAIKLKIGGKWKDVPKKAFADIESPLLEKAGIRREEGYDDSPWLSIYFEATHRDKSGKWNPKMIHIAYHKGRFEHRSIVTPLSKSEVTWDKMAL